VALVLHRAHETLAAPVPLQAHRRRGVRQRPQDPPQDRFCGVFVSGSSSCRILFFFLFLIELLKSMAPDL